VLANGSKFWDIQKTWGSYGHSGSLLLEYSLEGPNPTQQWGDCCSVEPSWSAEGSEGVLGFGSAHTLSNLLPMSKYFELRAKVWVLMLKDVLPKSSMDSWAEWIIQAKWISSSKWSQSLKHHSGRQRNRFPGLGMQLHWLRRFSHLSTERAWYWARATQNEWQERMG